MIATIMKTFLLDTEFYGQPCDVEFVDVGAPLGSRDRLARRYSLRDLTLWTERRLTDRLSIISEALDAVSSSDRVLRHPRAWSRPEPEMPLFD
ncbi:hypothetical protein [Blastochloris tepida]|uniref:hypothetical protein n=1 Tax=Blastochloris tepida TaxID=2233851 RepID=UPI000F823162|nr:hypothetical protein [Blastochloris tepida]